MRCGKPFRPPRSILPGSAKRGLAWFSAAFPVFSADCRVISRRGLGQNLAEPLHVVGARRRRRSPIVRPILSRRQIYRAQAGVIPNRLATSPTADFPDCHPLARGILSTAPSRTATISPTPPQRGRIDDCLEWPCPRERRSLCRRRWSALSWAWHPHPGSEFALNPPLKPRPNRRSETANPDELSAAAERPHFRAL